jgi:hypothetical protein
MDIIQNSPKLTHPDVLANLDMSAPLVPLPEPLPPANGEEIASRLGVFGDESVQIALFPEAVTDVRLSSDWIPWGKKGEHKAYGIICNWMSQTRMLDLLVPSGDVRWWQVRNFAKNNGLELVPTRWSGSIKKIPLQYFKPGTILGVRFYHHGPWFWPLEKPNIKSEESPETAAIKDIV